MDKTIIDVSAHNGVVNWEKVKAAGISGAIIRCGFGQNTPNQDDANFRRNADECSRLQIPFGIYIYSYSKTKAGAVGEIQHALRLAKGYKLALPIFYDLEEQYTESIAAAKAKMFIDEITKNGYTAGIYASASWFKAYLKNVPANAWRWVASWGDNSGSVPANKPSDVGDVAIWQYTSRGKVNGVNGNVDMSILYRDFMGQDRADSGSDKKAEPKSAKKPAADKIEYYIIKSGDTLSAIAKAHKTTVKAIKALNAEKIKDVNKIMAGDRIRVK